MHFTRVLTATWLIFLASSCIVEDNRPNIVLIMADDVGFSDIGCYGSEINTPHIDRLAEEGMRFRTFYNMAKCNPTRSTLLTGLYRGGKGAVHLAQLARQAGYVSGMFGKEHFDPWVPGYCQADSVFDHSFYYQASNEYFLPPSGQFKRPFIHDGNTLYAKDIEYELSPMYKTDFITGYALRWLDDVLDGGKPFFLYLPYHSAHYPLQARPDDIAKYRGKYLEGWDVLRSRRYARMQSLGVLPQGTELSPPEDNLNCFRGPIRPDYSQYFSWNSMSSAQQDSLDLEMAVFAAMIDRMDQNIGRILEVIEASGELDNTLLMFLSDNGSCPFYSNNVPDVQPGPANSYWSLRTSWANLGNTPFRQYKQSGHEGGSHTPFIAFWPDQIAANTKTDQPGHVVDMVPTFLDIMEIAYPDSINGNATLALDGSSLLPVFRGDEREEPEYFMSGLSKFRMFRHGEYKIVKMNGGPWELYNIHEDPAELNNLALDQPNKIMELAAMYRRVRATHEK